MIEKEIEGLDLASLDVEPVAGILRQRVTEINSDLSARFGTPGLRKVARRGSSSTQ